MRCIYSDGKNCYANPFLSKPSLNYQPNEEEIKTLCNSIKFFDCPRFKAFIEVLQSK